MLFDLLFLGFTLGKEKMQENAAARQVEAWRNDVDLNRREFFADEKKWQRDLFCLCDRVGSCSNNEMQWNEAKKKLDLIEQGYFPFGHMVNYPLQKEELEKYGYDQFEYTVVQDYFSEKYASLYIKLFDVEKYVDYIKTTSRNFYPEHHPETKINSEVRKLLYDGKVTIGVPFSSGGVPVDSVVMTIAEARQFMEQTMEERFRKSSWYSVSQKSTNEVAKPVPVWAWLIVAFGILAVIFKFLGVD